MKKGKKMKTVKPTVIKDINESNTQMKKLTLILLGVILIAILLYLVTAKFLVKDEFQSTSAEESEVTITYDKVHVGTIFNRPYDTYYVFAYDSSITKATYYSTLLNNYISKGETKIYFLDLDLGINKSLVSDKHNKTATNDEELEIKDLALIKISKGKISKYYDNIDDIVNVIG